MKYRNLFSSILVGVLSALSPAYGQGVHDQMIIDALTSTVALAYIAGAAVVGYLAAVIFTAATIRIGYPPNMARLGCWIGASLWLSFVAFVLFDVILGITTPTWFWASLSLVSAFLGIMLYATRRQASRR